MRLASRLDAMLRGSPTEATQTHSGDSDVYDEGVSGSEASMAERVAPNDVVVLHDPLSAVLGQAVRERGAQVVLQVSAGPAGGGQTGTRAWAFLRPYTGAVDAYLIAWTQPLGEGLVVHNVAVRMPSPDLLAAKEMQPDEAAVGWGSVLADVVHSDRGERVAGMLHPRPAVAAR
jgi:trehalose synthase